MQRFKLIIRLPSRLSCIILQDWLSLKAVMALDSAFCFHSHRKNFLELLQSEEYFIREQVTISSELDGFYLLTKFGEKLRSVGLVSYSITRAEQKLVIENCRNLLHVTFTYADSCTPELWSLLRTNPHIESLKVYRNGYGAARFKNSFIKISLSKLRALVLRQYKIENANIVEMLQTASLTKLDLSRCAVAESVLIQIAHHCPRLKVLTLLGTIGVTDDVLGKMTFFCSHLLHLDISYANDVTDAGILSVVENLKGLKSLNIVGVNHQTDLSLEHIYTYCVNTLHTLVLNRDGNDNPRYSNFSVNTLLERCTQLRKCYLYDQWHDSRALILTPNSIRNLTTLVMRGGVVSEQILATIGKYGINLQTLIIDESYKYTYESLSNLVSSCPQLSELYYVLLHDYGVPVPENLTPAYWMEIRPQLCIVMATKDGNSVGTAPDFMNL